MKKLLRFMIKREVVVFINVVAGMLQLFSVIIGEGSMKMFFSFLLGMVSLLVGLWAWYYTN